MKRIPLTKGKEALVDNQDYKYLMQWKWHTCRPSDGKTLYARRSSRPQVKMHRLIAQRMGIAAPLIDHQDRNGLNNQRRNLRPATPSQSSSNRGKLRNNTSGATGVHERPDCQKWQARIMHRGKCHTRLLDTFDRAVAWRHAKAEQCQGPYAPDEAIT
jgi:hypothetical protein